MLLVPHFLQKTITSFLDEDEINIASFSLYDCDKLKEEYPIGFIANYEVEPSCYLIKHFDHYKGYDAYIFVKLNEMYGEVCIAVRDEISYREQFVYNFLENGKFVSLDKLMNLDTCNLAKHNRAIYVLVERILTTIIKVSKGIIKTTNDCKYIETCYMGI